MNGVPRRVALQRINENFLGLRITTVGHVNIGLGDRINAFVAVDRADAGLAEISLDGGPGVNRLAPGRAEHRVGAQIAGAETTGGGRHRRVLALAAPG